MGLFMILVAIFTQGCASLRPASIPSGKEESQTCIDIDDEYITWGGIAAGAGFLAGSGGITAALANDQAPRLAVGMASLGVGLASVMSSWFSNQYAAEYAAACTRQP